MNIFFSSIVLSCSLLSYASQDFNKIETAKEFYQARNNRDTATLEKLLHEDFSTPGIDNDTSEWNKKKWLEKMWCNACFKDTLEIISIEEKDGIVHIVTKHKSEVLRLLDIPYFKDLDRVYFQDDKISKIDRDTMPGYKAQTEIADKKFKHFSAWLYHKYPNVDINHASIIPVLEIYSNRKKKKNELKTNTN